MMRTDRNEGITDVVLRKSLDHLAHHVAFDVLDPLEDVEHNANRIALLPTVCSRYLSYGLLDACQQLVEVAIVGNVFAPVTQEVVAIAREECCNAYDAFLGGAAISSIPQDGAPDAYYDLSVDALAGW